jgi:mono/diheme cytochrome c family protein
MTIEPDANAGIDYRTTLNVARVHSAIARENPDRLAEARPISLWVALGAILMSVIGAMFLGSNAGFGTGGLVNYNRFGTKYEPDKPFYQGAEGEKVQDPMAEGEKVYKNVCMNCHQQNGLGVPGQYPPIDGSEWVLGSDERLAAIVAYGLSGPVTVRGQTYGAAVMPPHKPPTLEIKKLAHVLTYIRGAWGNRAGPVAPEGVTEMLKRIGERGPYSEAELKQIPEDKMLIKPAAPAPLPTAATPGAAPSGAAAPPPAKTP